MKVLIVEDELMARKGLEKILMSNYPDIEIIGECGSVAETVAFLKDNPSAAEIIFMDVELSDGECFEIFRQVDVNANVVMTTAYDNYAVKAFEAGSVDYLLKPIEISALKRAVDRCRTAPDGLDVSRIIGALNQMKPEPEYKERYLVHFNDRIVPVKSSEVAFFYSEDKNNHLVTHEGTVYIVDTTMDALMSGLDPEIFFRVSRSCIFAKEAIESVTKLAGGRLRVTSHVRLSRNMGPQPDLTVSRSRVDEFLEWLEK